MTPSTFRYSLAVVVSVALLAVAAGAQDGGLDTTFGGDGVVSSSFGSGTQVARAVAVFPDGSLLVGGSYGTASNTTDFYVVRYQVDGDVEPAWGQFGGRQVSIDGVTSGQDDLEAIVLLDSGAVVLLGATAASGGAMVPALVGLTSMGDLDPGFGTGGIAVADGNPWGGSVQTRGAAPHLDGFLLAGTCSGCGTGGGSRGYFLYRATADGDPDASFGTAGWLGIGGWTSGQNAWAVQTAGDGRIVLGATLTVDGTKEVRIYRLLANGAPDPTFGGGDGVTTFAAPESNWNPSAIAIDPVDGAIYVGLRWGLEESSIVSGSIARLDGSGVLDAGFGFPALTFDEGSTVEDLLVTSDRKILAVGRIDGNGSQTGGFAVYRLLASGAFDTTFDGNGRKRIEVDAVTDGRDGGLGVGLVGGKPLAVGFGETQSGGNRFALVRLDNALIFTDGFERGSVGSWSASAN